MIFRRSRFRLWKCSSNYHWWSRKYITEYSSKFWSGLLSCLLLRKPLLFHYIVCYVLHFQLSEQETCTKAYKQYSKSRPAPSPESVKRMKETSMTSLSCHPLLGKLVDFIHHMSHVPPRSLNVQKPCPLPRITVCIPILMLSGGLRPFFMHRAGT